MITPPNHQKDAVPSKRGWHHPRTNELLVARPMTQEQIDEYFGITWDEPEIIADPVIFPEVEEEDAEEETHELEFMTKVELEEMGREHGIELDRREKKSTLIERLKQVID